MLTYKHKTHGIKCHMQNGVKEILKNQSGNVCGLILNDGTRIDGISMVIFGTGISPNTSFINRTETGIKLDDKGAIVCDPFMQTSVKDIWAAGDVASYPYWKTGKQTRNEHWISASD